MPLSTTDRQYVCVEAGFVEWLIEPEEGSVELFTEHMSGSWGSQGTDETQPNETRKTESEREKKGMRATTGQTLPVYISTSLLWGTVPLENTKITKI